MINQLINCLVKLLKGLLVVVVIIMVFLVTLQVVSRYVFQNPTAWSEEAARYSLIYFTFIGAALAVHKKETLKITIFITKIPLRIRIFIELFIRILIIIFLLITLYYSFPVFSRLRNQLTPALRWSKSIVFMSVPLGSLVMLLCIMQESWQLVVKLKSTFKGGSSAK